MSLRVRFAPSPTGHLHVGNARTALFNFLLARGGHGTFVLRIEDTDMERSTRASEAAIYDDLRWLGLRWDEGPDVGGPYGPYRQSERLDVYRSQTERLIDSGAAYFCFCTPEQLEAERSAALAAGLPPKYSGRCRALTLESSRARMAAGEGAVIRFRVPANREIAFTDIVRGRVAFDSNIIGDPVLVRSDGVPAYNFAVVVDDALMRISHVVRGEDHISNTPRQLLIYEALGFTAPAFAHLSLVLGPDHTPLSKRHGATSVAEFRQKGYLPEALFNYLALIGWSPGGDEELLPADELASRFRLEQVGHSAGVFDEAKLAWVNRHYIKQADPARLTPLVSDVLAGEGWVGDHTAAADYVRTLLLPMIVSSVDRLTESADRLRFLFTFDAAATLSDPAVRRECETPAARAVIDALAEDLAASPPLVDREQFRAAAARVRTRTGQKGRGLFHPIRVALTGLPEGPELDLAVPAIDNGAAAAARGVIAPVVACRDRAAMFAEALRTHDGGPGPPRVV
jgi:glutamyl-tRNA synthetase/nondiscriminating glutamyl-tRNA synthetase